MLVGLAKAEIEVVEPLPIEFSQATPTIARPSEAMQWLNAHHVHSPITRHALVVLESIDAIDLAFDTFVCSLLDGEIDTSGYPEYNAVVGGVAAHWDEATGDMICRAVVGWGGRGVRGDTDRIGAKLLAGLLTNVLANQHAMGLTAIERPGPGRRSRRPGVRALRLRVGPRAGVLLPEVRHAPAARLTRTRPTSMPRYDYACAACERRFEVVHGIHEDGPTTLPAVRRGPRAQGLRAAGHPLQGHAAGPRRSAARRRRSRSSSSSDGGGEGSGGSSRDGVERRRRLERRRSSSDGGSSAPRPRTSTADKPTSTDASPASGPAGD